MPKVHKRKKSTRKPVKEHAMRNYVAPNKKVIRARQQQILKMYASGKPVEQIAVEMEMHQMHVTRQLNSAIDRMIQHYASSTPQQTFVRYAAFQMAIVQKLQKTYERYVNDPDVKQYNAAIQSLRGMSDIYDKVLEKGFEFGVIEKKKADRKGIEGKAQDIKGELQAEIFQLTKLIETIDDATQASSMIRDRSPAVQTTITYARIIRKPLKNEFGVIRAIPDWKYRQKVYSSPDEKHKSVIIPKDDLSLEQLEQLPDTDPDKKLHEALLEERRNRLSTQGKILVQLRTGEEVLVDKKDFLDTPNKEDTTVEETDNILPKKDVTDTGTWLVKPSRK